MSPSAANFVRASRAIARELGDGEPIKILLVEDQPDYAQLFKELLERGTSFKYEVDVVHTADEAFDLIQRLEHDLYVLDQHLGLGSTGTDLVRRLHSVGCYFPFVILTGFADEGVQAMELDCLQYADKIQHHSGPTLDRMARFAIKNYMVRDLGRVAA